MKTIHRLAQFIDYKGISLNSFDEKIEASNGYIGKQIKREASVGSDVLEKIACSFPELNMTWLLVGEGVMLKNMLAEHTYTSSVAGPDDSRIEELYERLLASKDKIIASQDQVIQAMKLMHKSGG